MARLSSYFVSFGPNVVDPTYAAPFLFNPVTADLNGDGNQDLIVLGASYPLNGITSPTPQPARVFFGDGAGGFSLVPDSVFPVASLTTVHAREVVVSDLNGDGRPDIFIADHGWDTHPFPGEQNRLFLSQSDGTWIDATARLPQLSDFSHAAAIADIDGNGTNDIVVGNGYAGQNGILPYALLNDGNGNFTLSRTVIPAEPGGPLDPNALNMFPGMVLTDLDGDGRSDLIVTADASESFNRLRETTIFWNDGGGFTQGNITELPQTAAFAAHIDTDAQPIDFNGDGLTDLLVVGTRGDLFYQGWFVQVLLNQGNRTFRDVTSTVMATSDASNGGSGQPWPVWARILDFNGDGAPDFALEFNGVTLTQTTPLVWLNDGSGRFTTLRVSDFVDPGEEWRLGTAHLVETAQGFSFITPQSYSGSGGLLLSGLIATRPVDIVPTNGGPLVFPDPLAGTVGNDSLVGGLEDDALTGLGGTDVLKGAAGADSLNGGDGNDTLEGGIGNDTLDGGVDFDTAHFAATASTLRIRNAGGGILTVEAGALGVDRLTGIERIQTQDGGFDLLSDFRGLFSTSVAGDSYMLLGRNYVGPVAGLERELFGSAASEVFAGTARNDFMNLFAGDDAANGGAGNDVIDGGLGSNFLTGGAGRDVFFSDGRGGGVTWTTITDWGAGEQLSVWGWRPGTSRATWVDSDGVGDFKGITMHGDLNGDSVFDTSVTWSGMTRSNLPTPVEFDGLLWFIG